MLSWGKGGQMAISGSPKKMAQDIADGYQYLTEANLKKYDVQDLRTIINNLQVVLRELRAEQVPLEDVMAIKEKNMKMSRVNQTITLIQAYAKKRGLHV